MDSGITPPDEPKSFQPITFLLNLRHRWEEAALIAVSMAIFCMAGYLLWPQPQAMMQLVPTAGHSSATNVADNSLTFHSESTSASEVSSSDSVVEAPDKESTSHRRRAFGHAHKKPEKPPITNINAASTAKLQLLPGIGPKMALRIIEYRKEHGAFATVEQVMEVKGIGPRKFEKLKPYLKI
ncbi:MAG TPA: helix-hairpin-helix domain-containing protein [Coleofasciculaceae cyanobacterium]|jgi:comEA protein